MASAKDHAVLSGLPRARRLSTGGRTVKMLKPNCSVCDHLLPQWWTKCKHNPYVSLVPKTYEVPEYSEPDERTGRVTVIGTKKEVEWESRPNWHEVPVNDRMGGETRVGEQVGRGCIFPWELRSPEFPEGLAECCQFQGCFQQRTLDGRALITTPWGSYCREIEAKHAKIDQRGTVDDGQRLEIGFNSVSRQHRAKQLEGISLNG